MILFIFNYSYITSFLAQFDLFCLSPLNLAGNVMNLSEYHTIYSVTKYDHYYVIRNQHKIVNG